MNKLFALVDCNNFFASCERVFNPALKNQPVVVLSNNDGCVIARSNEAKALGIGMAEPYFKCRDKIERHSVRVYSANFVLYGDMSARVMNTLAQFTPHMEVYSIDEAFLDITHRLPGSLWVDAHTCAADIRQRVGRDTGLPISAGVGPTKTLAKIANRIAKKHCPDGIFCLTEEASIDHWLQKTRVEQVWGIGHEKAALLRRNGIENALQLKQAPEAWVKKYLTVVSLKTVWELRGRPCIVMEEVMPDKQAITTSRSFGQAVTGQDELCEATASFIATAAQKLRRQHSVCGHLQLYVQTDRFKSEGYYANCAGIDLTPPTAYTPELIGAGRRLVNRIYKEGCRYKKAGVVLSHLQVEGRGQDFLFDEIYEQSSKSKLMKVIDNFNRKNNSGQIFTAAEGIKRSWRMKQINKSQRFTTQWQEILKIKI